MVNSFKLNKISLRDHAKFYNTHLELVLVVNDLSGPVVHSHSTLGQTMFFLKCCVHEED